MWPVLVLQFQFEVLMFHTLGEGNIFTPNSCSILVFFFSPESVGLCLPGTCFNVKMWPVLVLQFQFEVLMFHTLGEGNIFTPNSCSILVFFFSPESVGLYLPGTCCNVKMWPVLVLQFHFEVFMFHAPGQYLHTQFLWCSFVFSLK
jgi:hypothetical protein